MINYSFIYDKFNYEKKNEMKYKNFENYGFLELENENKILIYSKNFLSLKSSLINEKEKPSVKLFLELWTDFDDN